MEGLEKHYTELANAIIVQASYDYMKLQQLEREYFKSSGMIISKAEINKFFNSRWFGKLTTLDPGYLVRLLEEKHKKGEWKGKYWVRV